MTDDFKYGLATAGISLNDAETIVNSLNIKTFTTLRTMSQEHLEAALEWGNISIADWCVLQALRRWYKEWVSKPKSERKSVREDLTEEGWEEWILDYDPNDPEGQSLDRKPAAVTTTPASKGTNNNFKVDTRDIPKLPKNKSVQDSFSEWEEYSLGPKCFGSGRSGDLTIVQS